MRKLIEKIINFSIKLFDLILFLLSRFRICFFLAFLLIFYFKFNYILVLISPSVGIIIVIWSVHLIINAIKNKKFTWQVFFVILFFFSLICIIISWDNYISHLTYTYNIYHAERKGVLLPWHVPFEDMAHVVIKMKREIEERDPYFLLLNGFYSSFAYGHKMFMLKYIRPIAWFVWYNYYKHFDFHILRPIRLYIRNPLIDILFSNPLLSGLKYLGWRFKRGLDWIVKYTVWRTRRSQYRQRRIIITMWKRRIKNAELRGRRKYGHQTRKKRRQYNK